METFVHAFGGKLLNLMQLHREIVALNIPGFRGLSRTADPTTLDVWSDMPLTLAQQDIIAGLLSAHKPQPEDGWTAAEFAQAGIPMPPVWPPVRPGA